MLQALIDRAFKGEKFLVRLPDRRLIGPNGVAYDDAPLIVHIHSDRAVRRIAGNPGLAVGEAYMDGEFTLERGTLYDFLAMATRHLKTLKRPRWFGRAPVNRRRASRRNVAHHYDLSGELYRLFLDDDRQYSCAYFRAPGMSLEEAQAAKKRHLAAKLLLKPGQRVLDIGSGWGGLALTLAEEHGAEVEGVTLSEEQYAESVQRAAQRGLHDRVRFNLRDYRDVEGSFDRIVSVGMFEHVGPAHYGAFFEALGRLLKDDGVAVLHTIGRSDEARRVNGWTEKYIFPGGALPSLSQIAAAAERADLMITDVEVLRLHYAETLRAWRARFEAHRSRIAALYDERFCRMWEFYLTGSEAGFRVGELVVFQVQLAKSRTAVPQTRDYISDFDRAAAREAAPGFRIAAE
ncbi:class I SAM-dependent methyltransferase [Terricaulis sp.]|uniref:class I SAM-dependent methyltransferase n=1 Tax=Terricaulis sp. TaxID=2768686 RepID=UPI003784ECE3